MAPLLSWAHELPRQVVPPPPGYNLARVWDGAHSIDDRPTLAYEANEEQNGAAPPLQMRRPLARPNVILFLIFLLSRSPTVSYVLRTGAEDALGPTLNPSWQEDLRRVDQCVGLETVPTPQFKFSPSEESPSRTKVYHRWRTPSFCYSFCFRTSTSPSEHLAGRSKTPGMHPQLDNVCS